MGRRYGLRGPWVLRGVDLDLPPHTLVRVEGVNGTGKSTLLRLLAGVDAPTEGRITGRPRTAYVPERFPAALPFTAFGYLVHMGRTHGLPSAEAAARALEWLERFGAAGHARTPMAELSKGTSQKVAVAQALLARPELLVLDEAWTGLDTGARGELDRAVAERVAEGATVVFVDHDPRRLAGSAGLAYRLEGLTLTPAGSAAADPGPGVRIEATGVASATVPGGLPGTPVVERDPGNPRLLRLTTTAAYSDSVLHTLLTVRPPWHITGVFVLPDPVPAVAATGLLPEPAAGAGTRAEAARAAVPTPERTGVPAPAAPLSSAPSRAPAPAAPLSSAPSRAAVPAPVPSLAAAPAQVSPPGGAPERAPRPAVRLVAAPTRYHVALLARSQRWLAPVLLYAAVLGVGLRPGQPVLDSLGYAAAALVPVAAWLARLCVTQEPPAARTVTASAAGPSRAHVASLLAALGSALALGVAGTGITLLISEPSSTGHTVDVPLPPAALAGLLATACCALLGTAVGALCSRPVLRRRGWSLLVTLLGVLLALVGRGSPAREAVTGLVSGSATGAVRVPLLPLGVALAVAVTVAALTSRIASLRE
ncbi:ATP-binding cassette domain-containing protein [Streptomyces sp. NPDC002908]|uniref:ATP-binding cassette domain-containing protein n=1 Tax=Streptomyces sp. NPDC002908 TaxID=3364670 RepID=UPI003674CBBE